MQQMKAGMTPLMYIASSNMDYKEYVSPIHTFGVGREEEAVGGVPVGQQAERKDDHVEVSAITAIVEC